MGFYGNIGAASKIQLSFDRTYANRYSMEQSMGTDGVYAGRYVLVEYDSEPDLQVYKQLYRKNASSTVLYSSSSCEDATKVKIGTEENDIAVDTIVKVATSKTNSQQLSDFVFYICTGELNGYATFSLITSNEATISNYVHNYNTDKSYYAQTSEYKWRGYDSTVWQKVFSNGSEKYVEIAELNSVVPTFDISADAPTMCPIAPHFDTDSTNIHYTIHQQPQWGFRIKEANNNNNLPSDVKTEWVKNIYDVSTNQEHKEWYKSSTGTWHKENELGVEKKNVPAAIYYNKAGFDKTTQAHVDLSDVINIEPTGKSGNYYNVHGSTNKIAANDIQELSLILPSLGNTISDIWDIIYGVNLENKTRYRNIGWKYKNEESDTAAADGGRTSDLNTVAGCINSIHELMGQIITTEHPAENDLNDEEYNKALIYKFNDKYWYINKTNKLIQTTYPTEGITDYYNKNWIKKNNPSNGDTVYYVEASYSYVELEGINEDINTCYGLILEMRRLLGTGDSERKDNDNIQGVINQLNDIINTFDDLSSNSIVIVNGEGKLHSALTGTDEWVNVNIDGEENKIIISHAAPSETTRDAIGNKMPKFGESFEIEDWCFDNKGHKAGVQKHNVTLPKLNCENKENSIETQSSVITSFNYEDNGNKTKVTHKNIGQLKLLNYLTTTDESTDKILATDTLNKGLQKLEARFNHAEKEINNITADIGATDASGLKQRISSAENDIDSLESRATSLEGLHSKNTNNNRMTVKEEVDSAIENMVGDTKVSEQINNALSSYIKTDTVNTDFLAKETLYNDITGYNAKTLLDIIKDLADRVQKLDTIIIKYTDTLLGYNPLPSDKMYREKPHTLLPIDLPDLNTVVKNESLRYLFKGWGKNLGDVITSDTTLNAVWQKQIKKVLYRVIELTQEQWDNRGTTVYYLDINGNNQATEWNEETIYYESYISDWQNA